MTSTVNVALICFMLLLGEAAASGFDKMDPRLAKKELDLDERIQEGIKCFWILMCNKDTVLQIKEDLNMLTNSVFKEVLEAAKSVIEPSDYYPEIATVEHIRSDDTWVNTYRPFLCELPAEKKDNYTNALVDKGIERATELCKDHMEDEEDCVLMQEAMVLHNKKVEQKKIEGIC